MLSDELDNQDQNQLDYDQNQQVGYYDDQQGQVRESINVSSSFVIFHPQ